MAISDFFLDTATRHAPFVHGTHHHGLVLLSIFVSIFTATMALQTAEIARRTQNPLYRRIAVATGAVALGGGVWTTHFIGMLAFELPAHVEYAVGLTLFSFVPACAASWFALRLIAMEAVSGRALIVSGTLVGIGIGAMHYSGMAAMQTTLSMRYEPVLFALSIVVAIALAIVALWVRFGLRRTALGRNPKLLFGGGFMGLAIASMHYTGMSAVRFIGEEGEVAPGLILNATYISVILSFFTITVAVTVAALNGLIRSRELYQRMEEGTSRLRATLNTAVDGIITIDSRGLIQDFNQSAERLFGWKAQEVLGRNIKMLMPEPYQSAHDGYLTNYLNSGQPRIIGVGREVVGLRKDGSHMPMRLAVGRVDLPGELLFVGFVTDISERHAMEVSLRETAERAEQAAAAKSTFLANMSHEIRTPMNSIIGFTELLLQTDLTPVQRNHLNTVRVSSRSLLRLLNDILDTTKMEKGRLELERTDFSLKALAMQIESSLRLDARAKGLALTTSFQPDMPEYYRGDPLRVLQILTNLVGNAIKFTQNGSVCMRFERDADMVHIHVRDTGIGMTALQAESIFAPFTQADATISRRFGGTGLGTTIARQLVELMGGEITVDSVLGTGTTFHVRLPLALGRPPVSRDMGDELPVMPALRILIADDVPQNLELLALMLQRGGHEVTAASDGNEAVDRFANGNFDLVLMDVHMPGIDGLQAARLIRQHERAMGLPSTPIIALTASVMSEDREAARQAGMDGFSVKPLDPPRLLNEMARVLAITPKLNPGTVIPTSQAGETAIDWQRGTALWGDRIRLASAIRQFLDNAEKNYPLPQSENPADVDAGSVRFSLHGLRGAAGNLAMPTVAALAAQMEDLWRDGHQHEALQRVAGLRAHLIRARAEVTASLQAAGLSASVSGTRGPEPTPSPDQDDSLSSELLDQLALLHGVLRRSELDDELLERVCDGLAKSGYRASALSLRTALEEFEFENARNLVEQLIAERRCSVPS